MVDKIVLFLETHLSSKTKLGLAALALALVVYLTLPVRPITDTTVMITNLAGNSGGSGVILSSDTGRSIILTNAHVCRVATRGGMVETANGNHHLITHYKISQNHDLCLLTVSEDLEVSTPVASKEPKMFSEATVSGHPALYPTIVSKGHFSGKKIIPVLTGFKPCGPEDKDLSCMFFGVKPIVHTYESQVVSATIMPGSSGSAVFNDKQQVSGLVFAGQGQLGYAFIVPQSYVYDFINNEAPNLAYTALPDTSEEDPMDAAKRIAKKCQESVGPQAKVINEICQWASREFGT
jgi:hypothetical protein